MFVVPVAEVTIMLGLSERKVYGKKTADDTVFATPTHAKALDLVCGELIRTTAALAG
jgi:hypothetical protein